MKIDVVITEAIFRRFTMFDLLRRRKVWRSPAIFAGILVPCAIICFVMSHVRGAILLGSTLLVVGLGLPLYYFVAFFASLNQQIVTMGLKKRPMEAYSLELTGKPNGIHITNGKETADYEWKMVHHVYRDKMATYLYMTPSRAFILPDTSLEGDQGEEMWLLILENVGSGKCTIL